MIDFNRFALTIVPISFVENKKESLMKIIFLHGLGQDKHSWDKVRELLPQYDTETLDLFYTNNNIITVSQLEQHLCQELQAINEPFVLVGLSLGGTLALKVGQQFPQLQALVLSGTQYKLSSNLLYKLQLLIFSSLPDYLFKKEGIHKKSFVGLLKDLKNLDLSSQLSAIQLPSLIICGSKDWPNLPSSKKLAAALPQADFVTLSGGNHTLNTDHPQEMAAMIERFILQNCEI